MAYAVKEIFLTLQGEGGQAGRPAVFCRFAGCNLWSGREADRAYVCRNYACRVPADDVATLAGQLAGTTW